MRPRRLAERTGVWASFPRTASAWCLVVLPLASCGGERSGGGSAAHEGLPVSSIEVVVPKGATFAQITDSLHAFGLVGWPWGFRTLARLRGDDRIMKFGRYHLPTDYSWGEILDRLTRGAVVTVAVTIPEGLTLTQVAGLIAGASGSTEEEVAETLADSAFAALFGLPPSGFEGYLFPDTYRFAEGVAAVAVIQEMVARHATVWTEERLARLDSVGMSRHEIVTLASIVQAEAARNEEMPRIASVYRNRLTDGWPLQADPTVLYALGGWRPRLLYAAIDSVADHPYNTYRRNGLPPGPINAPGEDAIDAALWPADEPYMFFLAGTNGYHVFTETLAEHNRAKRSMRSGTGGQGG